MYSSDLLAAIHNCATIPVIDRLKYAAKLLDPLQMRLLEESLTASSIYGGISQSYESNEYTQRSVIV